MKDKTIIAAIIGAVAAIAAAVIQVSGARTDGQKQPVVDRERPLTVAPDPRDEQLRQAVLGTWHSKDFSHPDKDRPKFRLRLSAREHFSQTGDFSGLYAIRPGEDDPRNRWEHTCVGTMTGEWQLEDRILTVRLKATKFQLMGATINGANVSPEAAKNHGYSCDAVENAMAPGISLSEEVLNITGPTMRRRRIGTNEVLVYTRDQQ